ncbi:hypothetical protein [Streptomyces sp. NPDC048516]|uniref:hypothetical protein n=1 Tax=Streptomyces sp. NPDC048516 TaxID=3365565 RepID=UPI003717420F
MGHWLGLQPPGERNSRASWARTKYDMGLVEVAAADEPFTEVRAVPAEHRIREAVERMLVHGSGAVPRRRFT